MLQDKLNNEYFEWLFRIVSDDAKHSEISFRKLLMRLHDIDFRYSIPMDDNRYQDGLDLRYRFIHSSDDYRGAESTTEIDRFYSDKPCSVLEMMIALAIRCENDIMDNPNMGDRTSQWFWGMITNLGLGSMTDRNFDIRYVDEIIERFLDRKYEPDGKGGLFRIRHFNRDLRKVEIWYQLCWYLDSIN